MKRRGRQPQLHVHRVRDGRGFRRVLVDGKPVVGAFFADEKRGIVHAYLQPLKLDKYRKACRAHVIRGRVRVIQADADARP